MSRSSARPTSSASALPTTTGRRWTCPCQTNGWVRFPFSELDSALIGLVAGKCSVLKDLEPEDVYEDEETFDMLVARMRPLLGDLLEVSDGEARRRPVAQDEEDTGGPLLDLTLGSWMPEGASDTQDPRAYIILNHAVCDEDV